MPCRGRHGHFHPEVAAAQKVFTLQTVADRAEALIAGGGPLSVQVLNEFVAVASRKLRMPCPSPDAMVFRTTILSSNRD